MVMMVMLRFSVVGSNEQSSREAVASQVKRPVVGRVGQNAGLRMVTMVIRP
jgi:hypothetical protein